MLGEEGHLLCWDAEVAGGGLKARRPELPEILPDQVARGPVVGAANASCILQRTRVLEAVVVILRMHHR